MATRHKTVMFAFPMTSALVVDATVTNLDQITLYIPEASPTFISVFAEVGFQDAITATGGTLTEWRAGLRLGAAGYTTFTETDDIANSGENIAGVLGPIDFTSHFTTNWTGTSMTCDAQVFFDQNTGTTLGMNNVTMQLYVTYQYDDAAATQIKTVQIPMESLVGALPTTATNFGTNQIPQLTSGGILPEASPVIRDWFIVLEGNEGTSAATDWTMSCRVDAGATTTFMNQETALISDRFARWIYRPGSVPDPTAAHNFQLWSSTARANHMTATLVVTYEFTLAGTTRQLNSLQVPIEMASPLGLTTTAEASRAVRSVLTAEPGALTLRQSAFRMNWNVPASVTSFRVRMGAQAYRNYTPVAGVVAGMFSLQQRIDSGGAQGAWATLARGYNDFVLDAYTTNASQEASNVNGYIILNYESDLPAGGPGQAAHTVFKLAKAYDGLLQDQNIFSSNFQIPETNYITVAVGFCMTMWSAAASQAITMDVKCLSGEGKEAGYYDIYTDIYLADAELGCNQIWAAGRDTFKRYPAGVSADRVDIETTRNFRKYSSTTSTFGAYWAVTYQSLNWVVAGAVSGHNAALPTTVRLIRESDGELRQEQVLTAGTTAFSFTVHDNTEPYYVDAWQDATHIGRSAPGTAE